MPELVPQVFEHEQFGKIRVVILDGKPHFVAVDLCRALGYKNTRDALKVHVDDEDKNAVTIRSGIPGNPNMIIVNESRMYFIFGSKLPATKKFTRWVTSEVLPSIRKYGYYTVTEKTAEKPLTEREKIIKKINEENPDDEEEFMGITLDRTPDGKQFVSHNWKLHGELAKKVWEEFLSGKTAFTLVKYS